MGRPTLPPVRPARPLLPPPLLPRTPSLRLLLTRLPTPRPSMVPLSLLATPRAPKPVSLPRPRVTPPLPTLELPVPPSSPRRWLDSAPLPLTPTTLLSSLPARDSPRPPLPPQL